MDFLDLNRLNHKLLVLFKEKFNIKEEIIEIIGL